ncbi:MAG: membrane protein [Bacteroidia bacterium]|nr:MAG: membrane protein [Bacteroidia bacterium]
MKKIVIRVIILLSMIPKLSYSQQDPQFSMYMFNRQVLNPAYAGSNPFSITTAGRSQWVGIDGHPNTFTVSASAPIQLLRGGIGGYIMADKIGPLSTVAAKFAYAFKLPVGSNGASLHLGLEGGILQKSLDGTNWRPEMMGDLTLLNQNISLTKGDLSTGIYFTLPDDKFYVGVAGAHLLEPKLDAFTQTKNSRVSRGIGLMTGYRFDLNDRVSLTPSFYGKMTKNQMQMDFNANVDIKPMVFGVSYRLRDSFIGIVGFHVTESLFTAYSYDYTVSGLGAGTSGSHELVLTYTFPTVVKYYPPDLGTRDKRRFR